MQQINEQDILNYLNFLNSDPREIFSFAFLDFESKHQIKGLGVKFFTPEKLISFISSFPKKYPNLKYTLHTTLNHTSTAGRKATNVESVRVLCLELDTKLDRAKVKNIVHEFGAHCVVESSPDKFHIYWKIESTIPLENWLNYQSAIAYKFKDLGSDFGVAQLSHTIRVPGIERRTKDGLIFLPRIVYLASEINELSEVEVGKVFGNISELIKKASDFKKRERSKIREFIKKGDFTTKDSPLGRNDTLYMAVKQYVGSLRFDLEGQPQAAPDIEDAIEYGKAVALDFPQNAKDPFTEEEILKTIHSAHDRGMQIYQARVEKFLEAGSLLGAEDVEVSEIIDVTLDESGPCVPAHSGASVASSAKLKLSEVFDKSGNIKDFTGKVQHTTNGHHKVSEVVLKSYKQFDYNYDDPLLRVHRFSDMAVSARVIQRYHSRMVLIGEQLYAFDDKKKIWTPQSPRSHPQLLNFLQTACLDTIHDPLFIPELCTSDSGEVSDAKMRRAKDKFTSGRMHNIVVQDVLNSDSIAHAEKEQFDAKEELLYVSNGVLNMLTGELRDAQPEDYLLNQALGVRFDAKAKCPKWEAFVMSVFEANDDAKEMYNFIQELFGYSLSGSIAEQRLFCHFGDGCNGKSKVLSALARMLGNYATYLEPAELVRAKNGFDTKFERFGAKIEGKRVGIVDDIDVKAVWNEGTVKNLTADTIRARAEYERSRTVMNRTKLHLGLNVAPTPEAENFGILRRLCFIPYKKTFDPNTNKGREIDTLIKEELPGILNWSIRGYKQFYKRGGLVYPSESELAVQEYRAEHFSTETLVRDMFEKVPEGDGSFEALTDLANDMNKALSATGNYQKIEVRSLAHALKREFGVQPFKKWDAARGNSVRVVNIKLKYKRAEAGDLL